MTVNGELTRRDYTESLIVANNVEMAMSAGGNGYSFSFSYTGGNQFVQSKSGSLTQEHVNGHRRGGTSSGFSMEVNLNPNAVYNVSSRDRNTYFTEFDYTRYFDENGEVLEGNAGLTLNNFNSTVAGYATQFNSGTGERITDTYSGSGERTDDNTITNESSGSRTTEGPGGSTTTPVPPPLPEDQIVNVGGSWSSPPPQALQIPNPAGAGLFPNMFFGQGQIPFGSSLFGSGFGARSGRAPFTNLPSIMTGTEPDGTYWERYDNGTYWIYREYNEKGGKLIREEWGAHVLSLPELIAQYQNFLKNRKKFTDIDLAFSDVDELMDKLDRKGETASQEAKLESLRTQIKSIKRQLLNKDLNIRSETGFRKVLNKLVKQYINLDGDLLLLNLNNIDPEDEDRVASDIEKKLTLLKKVEDAVRIINLHEIDKELIRKQLQEILDKLPGPGRAKAQGKRNQFKPNEAQQELLEDYRELQRKLKIALDTEAINFKSIRKELYEAWLNTLSDSERRRFSRGGLKQPIDYKVPLSEDEQERKENIELALYSLLLVASEGTASFLIGAAIKTPLHAARIAKLKTIYGPETQIGKLLRKLTAPKRLKDVNLKGIIQGYGMNLPAEGRFFGWVGKHVTKSSHQFTKEQLITRGWTKERLAEVAEAYEHINRLTPGHGNPSAASRAAQLWDLIRAFYP